jgi:hypothetical protein
MNDQASPATSPADGNAPAVEAMEFADFLESVPPSQPRSVKNLGKRSYFELQSSFCIAPARCATDLVPIAGWGHPGCSSW